MNSWQQTKSHIRKLDRSKRALTKGMQMRKKDIAACIMKIREDAPSYLYIPYQLIARNISRSHEISK